ncbi:cyclin-domain-containing protein [Mycena olivaceomarginata]|nr:cyclin-domain-containing protein [Mycena olivaceomarginata]
MVSENDKLRSNPSRGTPEAFSAKGPIWPTLTTASRGAFECHPNHICAFEADGLPTISLEAYLMRILKYCPTSTEVFVSLLVYFDRMSRLSKVAIGHTLVIDSYNIHRLLIAGVTVASKFTSDVVYTNSRWAKVGGLSQAELNELELLFMCLNDFRFFIPRDEMKHHVEQLNHCFGRVCAGLSSPPTTQQVDLN